MENTKELLQLPDEILLQILIFVPNRFEVSQVCKKFYEIVCAIEKNRFALSTKTVEDEVSGLSLQNNINFHKRP